MRPLTENTILRRTGDFFQRHLFTPYALGYAILNEVESQYTIPKFAKTIQRPTIAELNFSELKTSNTLYILGTGSSVNRYNSQDWDKISKGDSVGVNYWAIHDFIPDFYSFELPRETNKREALYHLFQAKKDDYTDTIFLLKDVSILSNELKADRLPSSIINNLYVSREIPIPVDKENPESLERGCEILYKLGYFSQDPITRVPSRGASIVYLISLGINMGYEDIVLCGVDLSNPEHFYTERSEFYLKQGIPLPQRSVDRDVHKTASRDAKAITVIEIIKKIQKTVLSKCGSELFVGSKESALYPGLKYYFNDRV